MRYVHELISIVWAACSSKYVTPSVDKLFIVQDLYLDSSLRAFGCEPGTRYSSKRTVCSECLAIMPCHAPISSEPTPLTALTLGLHDSRPASRATNNDWDDAPANAHLITALRSAVFLAPSRSSPIGMTATWSKPRPRIYQALRTAGLPSFHPFPSLALSADTIPTLEDGVWFPPEPGPGAHSLRYAITRILSFLALRIPRAHSS